MNNPTHLPTQLVDARLVGSSTYVTLNDDHKIFTNYVRVETPGLSPLLLQAHEAYALAAALDDAANVAEKVESAR